MHFVPTPRPQLGHPFCPGPRNVNFPNRKSAFREFPTFSKTENHGNRPATFTFLTRKVNIGNYRVSD